MRGSIIRERFDNKNLEESPKTKKKRIPGFGGGHHLRLAGLKGDEFVKSQLSQVLKDQRKAHNILREKRGKP